MFSIEKQSIFFVSGIHIIYFIREKQILSNETDEISFNIDDIVGTFAFICKLCTDTNSLYWPCLGRVVLVPAFSSFAMPVFIVHQSLNPVAVVVALS